MLTVWLIVVLLILINAFYVAAEFGAVRVRRSKVRQLAEDGHLLAALIAESREGGALRAEAAKLLQDLLRFTELTTGEVMAPRVNVVGISLGASASELSSLISGSTYTRFPVHRDDQNVHGCR